MSEFNVIGEVREDKSIGELLDIIEELARDSNRSNATTISGNMDSIMHLAADVQATIEAQRKK